MLIAALQVRSLSAGGGADGPEDVLPALTAAATLLDWQAKVRFLVLVTDAPAHGRDCNDKTDDQYPGGSPSGQTVEGVMKISRPLVVLHLVHILGGFWVPFVSTFGTGGASVGAW